MTNPFREAMSTLPGHWLKGDYTDGQGNYCTAGHVWKALGATDELMLDDDITDYQDDKVWTLLNQVAFSQFPERGDYISFVNDDAETTEDDVLLILDKAAVEWDARLDTTS